MALLESAGAAGGGRQDEATALLKPLSYEYNFYGQLALEELGDKVSAPPTVYKPVPGDVRAMAENPAYAARSSSTGSI